MIHLTPGNAADVTTAANVLAAAPGRIKRLLADRGYDANHLRAALKKVGTRPVIPGTRSRKRPIRYDKQRYRDRWRIEATFSRLKDFRRVATRLTTSPQPTSPRPSPSPPWSPYGADQVSTLERVMNLRQVGRHSST